MKGTTAEDCASQINSPSNRNITTIGVIHQSLFAQRNEKSSFTTPSLEAIFLISCIV